ELLEAPASVKARFVAEVLRRVAALATRLRPKRGEMRLLWIHNEVGFPRLANRLSSHLIRTCRDWSDAELAEVIRQAGERRNLALFSSPWTRGLVDEAESREARGRLSGIFAQPLRLLANSLRFLSSADERRLVRRIEELSELASTSRG